MISKKTDYGPKIPVGMTTKNSYDFFMQELKSGSNDFDTKQRLQKNDIEKLVKCLDFKPDKDNKYINKFRNIWISAPPDIQIDRLIILIANSYHYAGLIAK